MSSERKLLVKNDPWWGEHVHRYITALDYIEPADRVLDIACGTGYGSEMLTQKAQEVVGGDIDRSTIDENLKLYSNDNLSFQVLDGTHLPFQDESFDVLVSFETIEHTKQFLQMLKEFKRVTKKGGRLLISTPNRYLNSPNGTIVNRFHTQEWTPSEFMEILNSIFLKYELVGQLYNRYENISSMNYSLAKVIEKMLYLKGFRKAPLYLQDKIMNTLIQKPMYPIAEDYVWTNDISLIEKKCVTQMAIIENI